MWLFRINTLRSGQWWTLSALHIKTYLCKQCRSRWDPLFEWSHQDLHSLLLFCFFFFCYFRLNPHLHQWICPNSVMEMFTSETQRWKGLMPKANLEQTKNSMKVKQHFMSVVCKTDESHNMSSFFFLWSYYVSVEIYNLIIVLIVVVFLFRFSMVSVCIHIYGSARRCGIYHYFVIC